MSVGAQQAKRLLNAIMKILTICLIIAGLAFGNGALAKEIHRIVTEDSAVSKACFKDENGQEKCTIREDEKTEGLPRQICDLKYELFSNASLLSLAYRKAILKFTDVSDNTIVAIELKNCTIREMNLDVELEKIRKIVLRDDKYYVIFFDAVACKEFYCKAIYDINGKIIKENGVVPLIDIYASSDISVVAAEKGLLVNEYRLDGQVNLYFVPFEDFLNPSPEVLFSVPHSTWYGVSTLQNKLGFCAFDDGKISPNSTKKITCIQYDAEGKNKLAEREIKIAKENHVEFVRASNYDNGLFVTVNEWQRKEVGSALHTFVLFIDEHGKQDRLKGERYEVDVKCEKDVDFTFLKSQVYWIINTCFDPYDASYRNLTYTCLAEDCFPLSRKSTDRPPRIVYTYYDPKKL